MYNDLKLTLEVVEELGQHKLADALAKASVIGTQWMWLSWSWPYDPTGPHQQGRGLVGCRRSMA